MAKPKTKLTNIRPREVGLVDVGAVQEDFYVTKKQEGGEVAKKQNEKVVLKKMAVAIHTINFFKSQFTKEEAIEKMAAEGIQGAENFEVKENDWEYKFVVNDADLFEGTSLASYNYVSINQGVDSLVGVLKSMVGVPNDTDTEIEKAGKKLSKAKMEKLQKIQSSVDELIKELSDTEVEKDDDGVTVVKSDENNQTKENDVSKTTQKNQDGKPEGEVSADEKVAEGSSEEKKVEDEAAPEEKVAEESSEESAVEKRLKSIEDKQEKEVKTLKKQNVDLKEENVKLEKRLQALEDAPADPQGETPDETEEVVEKSQKSLWAGVL